MKLNLTASPSIIFLILIVQITLNINNCFCQIQFQRSIGGQTYDEGKSIIQTKDGGYAAAGFTDSYGAGNVDMYIVKFDSSGMFQWSKTIGGGSVDVALSFIQTIDGGYAAAGITISFGAGNRDMFLVKLDSNGSIEWSKTFGGSGNDWARSVIQASDGGYALAGYTESFGAGSFDMFILKLDANGLLQWCRTIGGTSNDYAYSIIQTTDGSYMIAGYTQSFGQGNFDMYAVKLDGGGALLWSKTIGGIYADYAYSVLQAADGGFVLSGDFSYSISGTNSDMYIVKLSSSGSLLWTRTIGGVYVQGGRSIVQTSDSGYAAADAIDLLGGGLNDMFIVKLNINGNPQWSRGIGGTGNDEANSVIQTKDGGYAMTGYTYSYTAGLHDLYLVKLDAGGNTCSNFSSPSVAFSSGGTLTSPVSTVTSPTPIITSPVPVTGTGGIVTSICSADGVNHQESEIPEDYKLSQNYPNPFNPSTKISFSIPLSRGVDTEGGRGVLAQLKIYNILGREVALLVNESLHPGSYEVTWDASNFPSGTYFYKLTAGDYTQSKKMVLMK